jgi:N-acetylmuramoyl-L-alanine amidase
LTGGIALDPGHGGDDPGIVVQELTEKALALDLGQRIEGFLSAQGRPTHLTRNRDTDLSIQQRSAVANFARADAFVGLHFAGSASSSLRGPVVYYHQGTSGRSARSTEDGPGLVPWESAQLQFVPRSRQLAGLLQEELNRLFGTENQPIGLPLAVLAPVAGPAVLVEAGFLTNPEDYALILDPGFRDRMAEAMARVLGQFAGEWR